MVSTSGIQSSLGTHWGLVPGPSCRHQNLEMFKPLIQIHVHLYTYMGFPGGTSGEEPTCQCRRHRRLGFNPWVAKIPWRRKRQSTSVLLRGQSHVQRSLTGYSPWGQRKSDITEQEHEWHRITTENEHFVFLVLLKLPIYILCPLDLSFSY